MEDYSFALNKNYIENHENIPNKEAFIEELNNLHKEEHFLFLSIRNNVIMCLENKKIKWKEANYEH